MAQKRNLIAESYECTQGAIIDNTHKRVQYSLTLKPDIIEVFRVTRKETTLETTFKTLEEFLTWDNELKATYKNRITRKKVHHINHNGKEFEYTVQQTSHIRGLHMSDGLIIVPQSIITANATVESEVSLEAITISVIKNSKQTWLRFIDDESYQTWYKQFKEDSGKPFNRNGIRYYKYTQGIGFERVTSPTQIEK